MKYWQYTACMAMAISIFFLSTSLAGWQPDQTDPAQQSQSPFSLDPVGKTIAENQPSPPSSQPASPSPFRLPPKDDRSSAVSSGKTLSPFALPPAAEKTFQDSSQAPGPPPTPAVTSKSSPAPEETAEDLLRKGTELAREGKLDEARAALGRSLNKNPENLVALNNLGLVLRKLGRLDDALKAYQFALEIDGSYALTYKNLGVLMEKKGEKGFAVQAYRKYCLLAPDAGDIHSVTARADWLEGEK